MTDGRDRAAPDPQPGPATDPSAPFTGRLENPPGDGAPAGNAPTGVEPIVVTKPMAARPAPAGGFGMAPNHTPATTAAPGHAYAGVNHVGGVVTHQATQVAASVGVPSTLESPKGQMLLRAEAQTRIERPLSSTRASERPQNSRFDDVDSTMPDNAARDAAIRDAARAADEHAAAAAAEAGGSKRFGPPTLQSPNDGGLPSTIPPAFEAAVVDAILPSAAFVRPAAPSAGMTHVDRFGPPPIPAAGRAAVWNAGPPLAGGFGAGGAAPRPTGSPGPQGGPPLGPPGYGGAQPAFAHGHAAGSGPPYFSASGTAGSAGAAPLGHASPSAGARTDGLAQKPSALVIIAIIALALVVLAAAIIGVIGYLRASGALSSHS